MKTFAATVLGLTLLATAACDDPAKNATKAQVGTAAEPAAKPPATAEAFVFGNGDSKIGFVGSKVTAKHEGSFTSFSGKVNLVEKSPEKSSVTVEIQADSLSIEPDNLKAHLKSPDFFDVAKFPVIRFESTSVRPGGEKGASHTVTGNLTLHGVTKSITFPATIKVGDSVDVDAEFSINRKDFDMTYPGKADDLIRDDVVIKLQVRAKRAG